MHEENSQLMVFTFGQEKQDAAIHLNAAVHRIDGYNEFLADQVGDQMLLCRVDMSGEPEDSYLLKEGEDDLGDGALHALGGNESVQGFLDADQVQIDHSLHQVIDHPLLLGLGVGKGIDAVADLAIRHPVNVGDLKPVFIKKGNVQQGLQLVVGIVADVGLRTLRLQKTITLLPNTYRMGLNAGQILQILDGKRVHQGR